jgi:hypothetical protein
VGPDERKGKADAKRIREASTLSCAEFQPRCGSAYAPCLYCAVFELHLTGFAHALTVQCNVLLNLKGSAQIC